MHSAVTRSLVILAVALIGFTLSGGVNGGFTGGVVSALLAAGVVVLEYRLRHAPPPSVIGGGIGLVAGLVSGLLATMAIFAPLETLLGPTGLSPALPPLVLTLLLAYLGAVTGSRAGAARAAMSGGATPPARSVSGSLLATESGVGAKVLDTSVIIDGRIADIVEAGFIEGVLVIPQFILRELQQVADSSDPLKRNRGRKGLDILKQVQSSHRVSVQVSDRDYPDVREVDAKLLVLAEEMQAKILTNDYNLNKVAQLRGVRVLNVNDLANAMKPVVLPGEVLDIQIIKEGKERNQGVGYLDDGTMVVVDNGKRLLGQKVEVVVTSVIQTNAGKMIFCAIDDEDVPRPKVTRRIADDAPASEA